MSDNQSVVSADTDIISRIQRAINAYGPSPDEIAYELGPGFKPDDVTQLILGDDYLRRLYRAWVSRIVDTIRATNGNKKQICAHLGCERVAIDIWKNQCPEIRQALLDAREEISDLAEQNLVGLLAKGDYAATVFVLQTIGKDRGYSKTPKSTLLDEADRLGLSVTQIRDQLAEQIAKQIAEEKTES